MSHRQQSKPLTLSNCIPAAANLLSRPSNIHQHIRFKQLPKPYHERPSSLISNNRIPNDADLPDSNYRPTESLRTLIVILTASQQN